MSYVIALFAISMLAHAADPLAAVVPERPVETPEHHASVMNWIWRKLAIGVAGASVADISQSFGHHEINPILVQGRFGGTQALIA
jgi:hypothetical protein